MDALLMCGGEGTRLGADVEKPLFEFDGRPMVDAVLEALSESSVETTTAVTSPATPRTRDHLDVPSIDAPGDGYVADLQYALERVERPTLTVVADLPLLAGTLVDDVLERFDEDPADHSVAVCVPASLKRALGASVDATRRGEHRTLAPTGLNVVAGGDGAAESTVVSWDARLAVNVNRQSDAALAEALR